MKIYTVEVRGMYDRFKFDFDESKFDELYDIDCSDFDSALNCVKSLIGEFPEFDITIWIKDDDEEIDDEFIDFDRWYEYVETDKVKLNRSISIDSNIEDNKKTYKELLSKCKEFEEFEFFV